MKPRLVRVSGGPLAEIPIGREGLTIGRDASNSIQLDDPTVSSHHCHIELENDRFVLIDRESTNGTFVNGIATTRTYLGQGDEIRIGQTRFHFLLGAVADRAGAEVRIEEFEDSALVSSETVRFDPMDSAYFKTNFASEPVSLERMTHDMGVLLRLSSEINEIQDSENLQRVLLERIFQTLPAENGAILLGSNINQLFLGSPVTHQREHAERTIVISRTITEQVFASGVSVLRNDLLADQATSESIVAAQVHSILCVPLVVFSATIGVIYLATTDSTTTFNRENLELVTAIAAIAAVALEHVRYVEWLETQNRQLAHEVNVRHGMVGDSTQMQKVYEAISLVAPTDSPVLILGESGTGKELAARAIHNNSSRRNGPFVVVNCGAIADSLFISEMFGYVKGAFTGAERDQKGLIEEADGGTLFLDELGELPLHSQAALLRAIDEGQILRVGSTRPVTVEIRLISATNRPLKDEVQRGGFRADLYYRMGLPLELPPLRDRLEDIPLLVNFFLQKHKHYTQREIAATPPETIRVLQEYRWPGNVRELSGVIQWAVIFGKSDRIRLEDLPENIKGKAKSDVMFGRLDEAMESFERQFILKALEETRGNVVEAAALLVRAPNYLQRRISKLNLRDELERIRRQ